MMKGQYLPFQNSKFWLLKTCLLDAELIAAQTHPDQRLKALGPQLTKVYVMIVAVRTWGSYKVLKERQRLGKVGGNMGEVGNIPCRCVSQTLMQYESYILEIADCS